MGSCDRRKRGLTPAGVLGVAVLVLWAVPARAPARADPHAVSIRHAPASCTVAGAYPRLQACLDPPDAVARARVHFRAGSTGAWYSVDLERDGQCFAGHLPKPKASTSTIEYYLFVIDRSFRDSMAPDTAPGRAYEVRVGRDRQDCAGVPAFATTAALSSPLVVSLVGGGAGAVSVAGTSGAALAGFSAEGVVAGVGMPASAAGAAASGGGMSTTTVALGAAGVAAAVGGIALAAGGEASCTNAMVIQNSGGNLEEVGGDVCSLAMPGCRVGWRACVSAICSEVCSAYYVTTDGRRFVCGSYSSCGPNGTPPGTGSPDCRAAATALIQYVCPE